MAQGILDEVGLDTTVEKFPSQDTATQAASTVPRFNPQPGELRIVDEPRVLDSVQDRINEFAGNSPSRQILRQLAPRSRCMREAPEDYLANSGLGVTVLVTPPAGHRRPMRR